MAMHIDKCLKPGCDGVNDFVEQFKPLKKNWEACLAEIYALTWWLGPEKADAELQENYPRLPNIKSASGKPDEDP